MMTVLRQIQTFLLTQHSQDSSGLQEHILRGLLGVCKVKLLVMSRVAFHSAPRTALTVEFAILVVYATSRNTVLWAAA